jgi:hypothetical protein
VIEVKKESASGDSLDIQKLCGFTSQNVNEGYGYEYGVLITLATRRAELLEPKLRWFCNGREVSKERLLPGTARK